MRVSKDKLLEIINEVIEEIATDTAPPNPEAVEAKNAVGNYLNTAKDAIRKAVEEMGDYPTKENELLRNMLKNFEQLTGEETMVAEIAPLPSPKRDGKDTLYGENEELEEEIELNEEDLQELIMNELEALYE
tara:strand:- start:2 stop:397 length:396 start_codon:yes stop_codon:yes gene_type:complete